MHMPVQERDSSSKESDVYIAPSALFSCDGFDHVCDVWLLGVTTVSKSR